tara:strand:+ start:35225 stop:36715 length:1491 start_codon:yes stop_codon:yes gene_type:complete
MSKYTPYQFSAAKTATGMMDDNHLGIMFQNKPQFLKKTVTRLLSSEGVRNIDTVLDMFPVTKMEDEGLFYWDITGDNMINVALVEARWRGAAVSSATNNVGQAGELIELVFPEAYFSDVHMIVGEKNELYQLRIVGDPVYEGSLAVYQAELMGNNQNGMPGEELVSGKRFSKDFSPVEDMLSTKGGEISFASPARVGNEMTTIRIQHKEPGKNIGKKVATSILLKRGNQEIETTAWLPAVEWTLEKTWSYEKAHAICFSRSNRSGDGHYFNVGKSGYYIKQGMGLREQMEASNAVFYNTFSLSLLESLLYDIGEGKLDYGNDRVILMRTGERGAAQFHRAVAADASGWTSLSQNNPAVFQTTTSPMHPNALKSGFQFTEWISPMGYHVKVETDTMYDDKVRNKLRAPSMGGGVAESYRYDIYFVGSESEPNIYKVELARGDDWGYESGFRNPFTGERNIQNMSHAEDSATYTRYGSFGAAIVDPGRVISLIPTLLQ